MVARRGAGVVPQRTLGRAAGAEWRSAAFRRNADDNEPRLASRRIAVLAAALLAPAWLAAQPATPLRFSAGHQQRVGQRPAQGAERGRARLRRAGRPGRDARRVAAHAVQGDFFSVLDPYGNTMYTNQGDLRSSWNVRLVDSGNYRVRVFLDPAAAARAAARPTR
jgi:hypothetical protein